MWMRVDHSGQVREHFAYIALTALMCFPTNCRGTGGLMYRQVGARWPLCGKGRDLGRPRRHAVWCKLRADECQEDHGHGLMAYMIQPLTSTAQRIATAISGQWAYCISTGRHWCTGSWQREHKRTRIFPCQNERANTFIYTKQVEILVNAIPKHFEQPMHDRTIPIKSLEEDLAALSNQHSNHEHSVALSTRISKYQPNISLEGNTLAHYSRHWHNQRGSILLLSLPDFPALPIVTWLRGRYGIQSETTLRRPSDPIRRSSDRRSDWAASRTWKENTNIHIIDLSTTIIVIRHWKQTLFSPVPSGNATAKSFWFYCFNLQRHSLWLQNNKSFSSSSFCIEGIFRKTHKTW